MTLETFDALDDFAGPGGWDLGAALLGLRTIGTEHDAAAVETARAAGFARLKVDVAAHPSDDFTAVLGYIGSPPCTLFSAAGLGAARLVVEVLARGVERILLDGDDPATVRADVRAEVLPTMLAERKAANDSKRPEKRVGDAEVLARAAVDATIAALILEPARRIVELPQLRWVTLEQVPEAGVLWRVYVRCLRARGWSAWTGVLNAADYGVPQTRRRAILIASRDRVAYPPAPTHADGGGEPDLFGDGLLPWVTMREALGLDGRVGFPRLADSGEATPDGYRARDWRDTDRPAQVVTEKARSWVVDRKTNSKGPGGVLVPTVTVSVDRPAPTITTKAGEQWVLRWGASRNATVRHLDQPAPTVFAGHQSNEVVWRNEVDGETRKLTVEEVATLQSFPASWPWHGTRSKRFQQIGNAIPPLLAAHVLAAATGLEVPQLAAAGRDGSSS